MAWYQLVTNRIVKAQEGLPLGLTNVMQHAGQNDSPEQVLLVGVQAHPRLSQGGHLTEQLQDVKDLHSIRCPEWSFMTLKSRG